MGATATSCSLGSSCWTGGKSPSPGGQCLQRSPEETTSILRGFQDSCYCTSTLLQSPSKWLCCKVEKYTNQPIGLCLNWPILTSFLLIFLLAVVDAFQAWCGPCKTVVDLFRKVRNEVGSDFLHFAVVRSNLALLKIPSPLKLASN